MEIEPIQDVAHLGHIELLTPDPQGTFWFCHDILGMSETMRSGQSVFMRGWGDYEQHTLKITESPLPGLGHTAWRAMSPQALQRRAEVLEQSGHGIGWIDGDEGHGPAYQFYDPDGHLMEIYYDAVKFTSEQDDAAYLVNQHQKLPNRGAGVRRIDHLNLLAEDVKINRRFMQDYLGFHLREQVVLDNGVEAGAWVSVTPQVHDVAYTLDATRTKGRLHHLAYWLDTREDIMRMADLCMDHGVSIETGPSKHTITQGFFLYVFEPGGNRFEVFTGGYLIFAPDWKPVIWDQEHRARGQAWGLEFPATFHTYGTPPVDVHDDELIDIPISIVD